MTEKPEITYPLKRRTLLGGLLVASLLQEDPYLRIRQTEPTVDVATLLGQRFLGGVKRC